MDEVTVTRSANSSYDDFELHEYTVTFVGAQVAGNVPQLHVIDIGDNGCGAITNTTTGEVGGTTLQESFVPVYKVQSTADLAYNASAADVKAGIEALSGACKVDVARSVRGNGYEWIVTFSDRHNDKLLKAMRPNALLLGNIATYVSPEAAIVPVLRADLSTPKSGVPYYVRAAATNVVGTGTFRTSSPSSLQPAAQPPGAPRYASVSILSDTELFVQWEPPLSDGGEGITEYIVEWDQAATFDSGSDGSAKGSQLIDASDRSSVADVQAVRLSIDHGLYVSGSFVLQFDGQRTGSIPFDASATEVETALESLCTIGDVSVSRDLGPANGGHNWLVTIVSAAAGEEAGDEKVSTTSNLQAVRSHKLQADGENLLACSDATREGCWSNPDRTSFGVETRREIQRRICRPGSDFMLSYMGETTGNLSTVANATEIEESLEALYTVGDVTVTGSCNAAGSSYIYVTFENDGGDLPPLSSSEEGEFEEVVRGSAQVVIGRKPFSYTVGSISAVGPWTVRISAYNRIGFGDFVAAAYDSSDIILPGVRAPGIPTSVAVQVASAHSAWVYWNAPDSDGGNSVTDYIVEWDTSDGFDSSCGDGPEVQALVVSSPNASHTGESFNMTIGDAQRIECMDWDTSVLELQNTLRSSAGGDLNGVVVTRGGDGSLVWNYGYTYSVTFVHNATNNGLADFPKMQVVSCATGGDDVTFEVETIKDGTDFEASACQVDNLSPVGSATARAADAQGAGDSSLGTFGYLVTDLTAGVSYRTRVAAANTVAKSPWSYMGYPRRPTSFVSTSVPNIPHNVTVASGTQAGVMHVSLGLPFGSNVNGVEGLPLQSFHVEMARRVNEVQVVSVVFAPDATGVEPAYPTQGSYAVSVGNATTWCLDWNTTAQELELALDSLATVDGVSVQALQPGVNSTSNGTTSSFSTRLLQVSFTGPLLSNGDQNVMGFSMCTSLDAGAYLDIYTVTDGVAGLVSPVIAVSTTSENETAVSGSYLVSFGYRAELDLRLGEGNFTSEHVTVEAGSTRMRSSSDLNHYINEGDLVSVGGVELVVAGEFTCEDEVAFDNIVERYPCSFKVETPHPYGVDEVPIYGASNSLGSVHVERGSSEVLTDWDLTRLCVPGDAIIVRDTLSGEYYQSTLAALTATGIVLEDGYEGPSSVRAAAFFRPFAVVPSDASAEELRNAIESLSSVGSVEVTRQGPDELDAFAWSVTLTSFYGTRSGAHTLQVMSETGNALEVSNCGSAGNGTFVATGKMVGGRMQYKLLRRPSYIEYDSSADDGLGLWVVKSEGIEEPHATAVIGAGTPARDALLPPVGSASYWTTSCLVELPSSTVNTLVGNVTSAVEVSGVEGSFSSLAKDIVTKSGISEVQAIQLGASSDALDGTFKVDFADAGGFTAAWDITAGDMEVRGMYKTVLSMIHM